jgi:hypothetical protein
VNPKDYNSRMRLNIARVLIGIVFAINVQCAIAFLVIPASFAPGFELSGELGEAMVRGMGVLFLMWNVPYAVALWHPVRYRISLYEAAVMQGIGLLGESLIYFSLPAVHFIARGSIARFILFDGLGLLALLVAIWLTRRKSG